MGGALERAAYGEITRKGPEEGWGLVGFAELWKGS